jgi:hypothetical protein
LEITKNFAKKKFFTIIKPTKFLIKTKKMQKLLDFIQKNKAIALLAPSFPVDFEYPDIINILK